MTEMEPIRTLIIDDEQLARDLVRNYLKGHTNIQVIGECENGFEAIKKISAEKPDLIFLDIQMPKLNGFEMLEILEQRPEIIFITAHNEFAIRAFELNAVDYLLKPYSKERLLAAVKKVEERRLSGLPSSQAIDTLIREPLSEKIERVVVKTGTRIKVIPVNKITHLEAEDDYVMIFSDEGKHLKQATMKFFEDHLDPDTFLRVHRSFIVRVDQVTQLEPYSKENFILRLKNGATVKVSRTGLKLLKDKLNF